MTVIKIIFMLILAVMERCHLIKKEVIPIENVRSKSPAKSSGQIAGSWRMENVAASEIPGNARSDAESAMIISFFTDSTFTELQGNGNYRSGRYTSAHGVLSFTYEDDMEQNFFSFESGRNGRKMLVIKKINGNPRTFAEYAHPLKNFKEDPFYVKNNTWRVKSKQALNEQELRLKVANYILHNVYILKAAATRNQAVVSWEFSGGIIRVFNGGIGIVDRQGIPNSWKAAFFSDDDALRAYRLYEDCLLKYKPHTDRTGSWVQDDANILMRIYDQLTTSV